MSQHTEKNHFELFGLPTQFAINLDMLDQNYRKLQSEVHPDRFVTGSAAERLKSMQLATLANEAHQTLKNPTARARYLLQTNGIDTQEESNTAMPADFLMFQMEWREAIEDARLQHDIAALDMLRKEIQQMAKKLQSDLRVDIDEKQAYTQAAETLRKLKFIDKACDDIEQAIAALEN